MLDPRNPTRPVKVGSVTIGGGNPIVVQSMCATKTADVEATVAQVDQLAAAGAGVVRIAADTPRDCEALAEIRRRTDANLSVDLQENYRLAADVAPLVDKIRYNPGHLYHHERNRPWQDKVRFLVDVAGQHDCALRVGVNCGSVDPAQREKHAADDPLQAMLESALEHCELLDRLGFTRYCVSLKDSDPASVVEVNRRFAARAARRAAAPRRDRGRNAARGNPQNPQGLRAAPLAGHRRHAPRFAHRARVAKARGDRGRPTNSRRHRRRPSARPATKRPPAG